MKEIERVGIPVTQICAVVDIAKSVGSSRILRGFAITCPVESSKQLTRGLRRRYVEKALRHADKAGFQGDCRGRAVRQKRFSAYLP